MKKTIRLKFRRGIGILLTLILVLSMVSGCNKKGKEDGSETPVYNPEDVLAESIEITGSNYEYDPEEIMYLSGVKLTAYKAGLAYSLSDLDEDMIPELFVSVSGADDKTIGVYAFNNEANRADLICTYKESGDGFVKEPAEQYTDLLSDVRTKAADLLWVDNTQWVDSSIVGVANVLENPGEKTDFYLSANYDWLKEERVQYKGDSVSDVSMIEIIDGRKEEMFSDREKYQGDDIQILRDYYDVATDWEKRDAEGIKPVESYIKDIENIKSISDLSAYLSNPEKSVFCNFITLNVSLNVEDSSEWVLEIAGDNFSVLPRQFNNDEPESIEEARQDFCIPVTELLSAYGYKQDEIEQILKENFVVEDQLLSRYWISEEEKETAFDGYQSIEDFTSKCKNFPLKGILEGYGITKGNVTAVYPQYVEYLDEVYTEENVPGLKSYLLAHMAYQTYKMLNSELSNSIYGFDSDDDLHDTLDAYYKGIALSNREVLGVAEENAYMTYFVDEEVKIEILDMCADIKNAYRSILENEEWLSEEGKKAAIEKLDNLEFSALKPDKLIDSSYLAIDKNDSFLEVSAKLTLSQRNHNLSFVGEKRVKGDWRYDLRPEIAATVDNAFYYGVFNQFFICSIGLNEFKKEYKYEQKLGMLGAIVGHELTHGFDPLGIQYDKDGNMVVSDENPYGWLPKEDYEKFTEKSEKVAEYFNNTIPFPYQAVEGTTVWGEATADIGGIAIGLKIAESREDFDYDLYFRSFAELWKIQSTLIVDQGDINNEHPLRHLRVNVTLSQFDKFYETYGIKEGDLMYLAPEERINIW